MGGVREESVSGQGVGRLVGGEEFNGALKFMLIRVTHIAAISRSIRPSISFPLRVSSVHAMSDTLLTLFQLASISLKAKLKIVPWRQGCTQSGIFHAQSATLSWGGLTWVGCKKGHPHLTDALTVLQVRAYSEDNKYKEGKFILEKKLLTDVKWAEDCQHRQLHWYIGFKVQVVADQIKLLPPFYLGIATDFHYRLRHWVSLWPGLTFMLSTTAVHMSCVRCSLRTCSKRCFRSQREFYTVCRAQTAKLIYTI